MLIGIQGGLGDGKTIMLTRYLLHDFNKGHKILCNYQLFNIEYENLIVENLLKNEQDGIHLKNVTIGIDELTVYADCRLSMSKANLLFGYLVLQSRKRSVDIYYTTQDFRMIDKRVLHHTHIQIIAESLYDKNGQIIEGHKKYSIVDARNVTRMTINRFVLDIRPYYDYYDTDEIITPPILKKE